MRQELRLKVPTGGPVNNRRLKGLLGLAVYRAESLPGEKAGGFHLMIRDLPDDPFTRLIVVQIPDKTVKTVPHQVNRTRRPPHLNGSIGTIIIEPEEGVEARHMIHVEMRQKKVGNGLNRRGTQIV